MSNSDWIKHIAVGLTAIAVTFIWAAYYVGSQIGESRGESNKHTTEYERHAEEQIRATCLSGQTGDIAECVSKIIKTTNEDRRAQDDLVAQTEMARWAFYMLIATIGVAVITGAGVYYVWRTLSVTREIGEAQVRSYIYATEVKIDTVSDTINLVFKNFGNSPGIIPYIDCKVIVFDPYKSEVMWSQGFWSDGIQLAPQEIRIVPFRVGARRAKHLEKSILENRYHVAVQGRFGSVDVFKHSKVGSIDIVLSDGIDRERNR